MGTQTLIRNALIFYSRTRSANFALQYWALNRISSMIGFKTPMVHDKALIAEIQLHLDQLIQDDIGRIQKGFYPVSVLKPESPIKSIGRFPKVIIDSFFVGRRRTKGAPKEFTPSAKKFFDDVPKYYQRNFHFQTDGYLSTKSAEVYDYEVELIFSGAAGAMRRLMIAPFKNHFKKNPTGKGLQFLEVGAGTGRATRFMKLAFPDAKIVAIDLSDPYLKSAQTHLKAFHGVSFLQADGAALPFKKEKFDAVYSVFIFHELPLEIRMAVMKESVRVLKKSGIVGFVDSIQKGDLPKFDHFLTEFPKNFHEPFYLNYVNNPMSKIFSALSLKNYKSGIGLMSKYGFATKSARSKPE
jgi:ubiquinone/menaquinone biosynthesis C-methylase UbiE